MSLDNRSDEHRAGWSAFIEGRDYSDCPYMNSQSGQRRWLDWNAGWEEAKRQATLEAQAKGLRTAAR